MNKLLTISIIIILVVVGIVGARVYEWSGGSIKPSQDVFEWVDGSPLVNMHPQQASTPPVSGCNTYSGSGDWSFTSPCNLDTATDLKGNKLIVTGVRVNVTAKIYNYSRVTVNSGGMIDVKTGGDLMKR